MNKMEKLDFEFLNFGCKRKGAHAISKNEVSVSIKSGSGRVAFGRDLNAEVEPYKYLRIARQRMTSELYFVFNNEAGIEVRERKCDGVLYITNKELAAYLFKHYNIEGEYTRINISDNLANDGDFATYRITIK